MRVLHVITRMILGGAQENTMLSIFGQMENHNCEVALLTGPTTGPEGTIVPLLEKKGVPVFVEPSIIRSINPTAELKALRALRKKIKEWKPDVVHTHSSKAGVLGRIAAWQEKVPFIVHTIHGLPFHPYQTALKNFIYITAEKYAAKRCHKIVSVADAMTSQALAAGVGRKEQYLTIYSGMEVDPLLKQDFDRQEIRKEFGFSENDFVIGKVARLFELKGHEYL
ncbi:MAG: glycosyltransferase, partial [Planctomycetota bacterium]